jgi:hypothetical protein
VKAEEIAQLGVQKDDSFWIAWDYLVRFDEVVIRTDATDDRYEASIPFPLGTLMKDATRKIMFRESVDEARTFDVIFWVKPKSDEPWYGTPLGVCIRTRGGLRRFLAGFLDDKRSV